MGRKITIEETTTSASDIFIECVSSLGGIALGMGTGMYLDKLLPVAATTIEEVVRKGTVYLGSFTVGVAGSKAIESEMQDARDLAIMTKLMAKGLLSKEEAQAVEEKKETVKASAKK